MQERAKRAQRERKERIRRAQQERKEILRQVQEELNHVQREHEEILNQQKKFFKNLNFEYHTMNNNEETLGVQNKINAFEKIKKKIFKK